MKTAISAYFIFVLFSTGYVSIWFHLGLFSVLFLVFIKKLDWTVLRFSRLDLLLFTLYLSVSSISLFFSQSLTLGIESYALTLFSFLVYVFFLALPKKYINLKSLSNLVVNSVGVASLLSFVLLALGYQYSREITFTSYFHGHNHLAILLVFILPTIYLIHQHKKSRWHSVLFIVALLSLALSFSRVAMSITVLYVLLLLFKNTAKKFKKQLVFLLLFLTAVIFSVSFSKVLFPSICEDIFRYKVVFCKDIRFDQRFLYWKQGVSALDTNTFLLGIGPGSYQLSNHSSRIAPNVSADDIHNLYLEQFVERGLLGGLSFILLILYMMSVVLKTNKKITFYIGVGLVGVFTHLLFNVDFSLAFTQLIIFSFFGLIIRQSQVHSFSKMQFIKGEKLFVKIISIFLLLLSVFYYTEKFSLEYKDMPLFNSFFIFEDHKKQYFKHFSYTELYPFFKHDFDFYLHFYADQETENKDVLVEKMLQTSPYFYVNDDFFEYYLKNGMLDEYETYLNTAVEKINAVSSDSNWYLVYRLQINQELFKLYKHYVLTQQFEHAQRVLRSVYLSYQWSLYDLDSIFFSSKISDTPSESVQELHQNLIFFHTAFTQVINNNLDFLTLEKRKKIAQIYLSAGNQIYDADPIKAIELYRIAMQYNLPHLQTEENFLQSLNYLDLTDVQAVEYAKLNRGYSGAVLLYREKETVQIYQKAADYLIKRGMYEDAETVLRDMQEITHSSEVFSYSQLGNLYLLTGRYEEAEAFFETCMSTILLDNNVCYGGREDAQAKNNSRNFYYLVRSRILSPNYLR